VADATAQPGPEAPPSSDPRWVTCKLMADTLARVVFLFWVMGDARRAARAHANSIAQD